MPTLCVCMHRGARAINTALSLSIEAGLPVPCGETAGSSCCAAFALGSTRSTACPASYGQLFMAGACEAAAGAVGIKYGGSVAYSSYPYGCYWHTITGSVYYNSNGAGAANAFAQPLCSGATFTGDWLFAIRCAVRSFAAVSVWVGLFRSFVCLFVCFARSFVCLFVSLARLFVCLFVCLLVCLILAVATRVGRQHRRAGRRQECHVPRRLVRDR
jgi:hypothetical protein